MPQSYASLQYHLVFGTRRRDPLLLPEMREPLYSFLGRKLKEEGGVLLAAGGTADHVHLLAAISRERSLSETMRVLKATSSRWIHESYPVLKHFAWQSGYGAFTIGRTE